MGKGVWGLYPGEEKKEEFGPSGDHGHQSGKRNKLVDLARRRRGDEERGEGGRECLGCLREARKWY